VQDFFKTSSGRSDLHVVVDFDDDYKDQYIADSKIDSRYSLQVGPRRRLNGSLNAAAVVNAPHYDYLGFMGDDHRPRTQGWDTKLVQSIGDSPGVSYGNDLFQGERLPTSVILSSKIVKVLGYMAPPEFIHMYLDNTWKEWGLGLGNINYLPDVIIEHLHPVANKAKLDTGYVEAESFMIADRLAWEKYVSSGKLAQDIKKVKD
jgi:hypothetical protein